MWKWKKFYWEVLLELQVFGGSVALSRSSERHHTFSVDKIKKGPGKQDQSIKMEDEGHSETRRGCQLSLQAGECIKAWHFWCASCGLPMPNLEKWWWDWKLIWLQGEWDGSRGSMYMLVPRPSWISKPLGPWKTLYLVWGTGTAQNGASLTLSSLSHSS